MKYYFLNEDHTYRPCSLEEWANQMEELHQNETKHVAIDVIGNKKISTIWLGLDHSYLGNSHHPLLFETIVFINDGFYDDIYMERYTTWGEALEGHEKAIQWVNNGGKDEGGKE